MQADYDAYLASRGNEPADIFSTNGNVISEDFKVISLPGFIAEHLPHSALRPQHRIFSVQIGGIAYAFITFDRFENAIQDIYTFGERFVPENPNYLILHEAFCSLTFRLDADYIPFDPLTHHLGYKVLRNGTRADTSTENYEAAFYGTIVVPEDVSARDLQRLLDMRHVTLDVSNLAQARIDEIRNACGTLYTSATQVVFRQLRDCGHSLIAPNATCLAAPALVETGGHVAAPKATFVHMPMLARVKLSLSCESLTHADFQNLGVVGETISLQALTLGAFPMLRFAYGGIVAPQDAPFYAPYLEANDTEEVRPAPKARELPQLQQLVA